jgi:Cdc6-like AAA superfamily ATPase
MTEPSLQSDTALPKATRESSSRLGPLNAKAHARRRESEVPKIGENMPNLASDLTADRFPMVPWGLYRDAGVPKRHARAVDETHKPWLAVRDELWSKIGSGFLIALVGRRGPGKTQLAEQVVKASTATERTALYTRAMSLFLAIRATYHSETLTEESVVGTYRAPKLLVIDEIQVRADSSFESNVLDHIIDLRYGDVNDTLIVGNLMPKALTKSLGPSVMDRLNETGRVIECTWDSFRKIKPGAKECQSSQRK